MRTILAVDDSEANNKIITYYLEKEGYKVFTSIDAYEAFDVLQKQKIDLIITDYRMPDINGLQFLEKLKTKTETQDIPVVFLSSEDNEELRLRAIELGANEWLTKPFLGRAFSVKLKRIFVND